MCVQQYSEYTVAPSWLTYAPKNEPPPYLDSEEAECKSLLIDVVDTWMKLICPPYNHDPKPNGWEGIWKTNFYPFCDATS